MSVGLQTKRRKLMSAQAVERTAMTDEERQKHQTELFIKHRAIPNFLALRYSRIYQLDYGQLLVEAESCYGLLIARWFDNYTGSLSKPSTYLFGRVRWRLLTFCAELRRVRCVYMSQLTDEEHLEVKEKTAPEDKLLKILTDLSDEARSLVHLILNAPTEFADVVCPKTRKRGRRAIRSYITDELGWSAKKLWFAWQEVQACL